MGMAFTGPQDPYAKGKASSKAGNLLTLSSVEVGEHCFDATNFKADVNATGTVTKPYVFMFSPNFIGQLVTVSFRVHVTNRPHRVCLHAVLLNNDVPKVRWTRTVRVTTGRTITSHEHKQKEAKDCSDVLYIVNHLIPQSFTISSDMMKLPCGSYMEWDSNTGARRSMLLLNDVFPVLASNFGYEVGESTDVSASLWRWLAYAYASNSSGG